MTFDEVVEIILGNTLGVDASDEPGKKDFIIKDDMVATGREALTYLINELKDNYAPTIEMTQEQYNYFKWLRDTNDSLFQAFLTVSYNENELSLFSELDLTQAWLHPETVEVVDNDV
ncbi:hypothetical protein [Weissella hellenica]|uniref:hypothetical protein n=1 Tax=Weissella hellenica TaxID=46256 RepID=UPI00388A690B